MTFLRTAIVVALLTATSYAQPAVTASDAWITEAAADGTAAVYLSISNPTMYDIYVVSAVSDVAGKIELRQADKPVKDITVPSFGFAEFKAGGPHLVLMDLKRALKAGESVSLTLTTEGGITVVATAVVKARAMGLGLSFDCSLRL